jgi:hypothetical protein
MIRNPSTFLRRGNYIYRLAQERILKEQKEDESDEDFWERFYEKHVEELDDAYKDIDKAAKKMMNKVGIRNAHLLKEGLVQTKDGADLIYNIETNSLPGAKLRFDFTIDHLENFKTFITRPYLKKFNVNEVILEYCDHSFVANDVSQMSQLMKSVGLLQGELKSRSREDLGRFTKDEADRVDYALGMVQKLIAFSEVDAGDEDLGDLDNPKYVVNYFIEHQDRLAVTDEVLNLLEDVLSKIPAEEWKKRVEEYKEDLVSKSPRVPSRKLVEEKIQDLTSHERYGGKVAVDYTRDGRLVAAINAPYPILYIFNREPGAQIKLDEVAMEFCHNTHLAVNESEAKQLISANLDFAEAYETAANVEQEGNTEGADDFEELVTTFHKLHRKEMVEFLKKQYPEYSEEKIEDLLKSVSRRSFERRPKE